MQPTSQQTKFSMTELILLLMSTLTTMAIATISPALPELEKHFADVDNHEILVRLIITMPALAIAIVAPIMGMVIDKWGRKKLLISMTVLYSLAGSSGFFLDSLFLIILGRALLGIAVAGIMTTVITLIADYYQGVQRAKMMGYQAAFMSFGGVVFLIAGGFLAAISWNAPFLIYLTALFFLPGILKYIHEPNFSVNKPMLDDQTTRQDEKQEFYQRIIIASFILIFGFQIIFFFSITELPFFLTNSLALNPDLVGIILASLTLSGGLSSLNYERVRQHFSFEIIFVMAFALCGFGFFLISVSTTPSAMVLSLLIAGVGLGLFIPNITLWLMSDVPESSRGRVSSGFTSLLFLGQFFSPLLSQVLLGYIQFTELFALSGVFFAFIAAIFLGSHVKQHYEKKVESPVVSARG
jgi:MFS family permease